MSEKVLKASSSQAIRPTGSCSQPMPDFTQIWMLPPRKVLRRFKFYQICFDKCFFSKLVQEGPNSGYDTRGTLAGRGPVTEIPFDVSSSSVTKFDKYFIC